MQKLCDLHTHSLFSDGTASPTELVNRAIDAGLGAIALTDHNTVAGLEEFETAAEGKEIEAIAGVEITTAFNGKELHVVGLGIQAEDREKETAFLSVMNQRKEESNRALVKRLREAGYDLCYDEIRAKQKGNVNRAVIAAALKEKGYVNEIQEAFEKLLREKHGYYVPPQMISSLEAIAFLRSLKVVPVLAHPLLSLTEEELVDFLQQAKPAGLVGMETIYVTYSPEEEAAAIRIAEEFGLLGGGGSDYHGDNKPDAKLGIGNGNLQIPLSFAHTLLEYKF